MSIGFDLGYDLELEFSRSNMEFAVSRPKMVPLPWNKRQTYRFKSKPQMWPSDLTLAAKIYRIVTGVTSDVGMRSTHLVFIMGISLQKIWHLKTFQMAVIRPFSLEMSLWNPLSPECLAWCWFRLLYWRAVALIPGTLWTIIRNIVD